MPEAVMAPVRPRRSLAGPIVLIILGVVFLLGNLHVISRAQLFLAFARYWPVLIILWGVIKLVEYYRAREYGEAPSRIGAGGIALLVFLIIIGLTASTASRLNLNALDGDIQIGDENIAEFFGGKTFTYTNEQTQDAGTADSLRITSNRGAVSVVAWDEPRVKLVVNKKVVATSEDEAQKIDQNSKPTITSSGTEISVDSNSKLDSRVVVMGADVRYVRSDMEIYAPRKMRVEIATQHGNVTVRDRAADVRVTDSHGDVTIEALTGNAAIEVRHGDVRAVNVNGNVSVNGRLDDTTVADVSGSAEFTGEFFGDMSLSKIAKGVTFRSSRTDMRLARLDGDLTLSHGELRAKAVVGPVTVSTRSKDIALEDISGALTINNKNGQIDLRSTKVGGEWQINNQRGDVSITMPSNSPFQADIRSHRGDISSEFDQLKVESSHQEQRATGAVGSGGPRVQVVNEFGNIEIRKG